MSFFLTIILQKKKIKQPLKYVLGIQDDYYYVFFNNQLGGEVRIENNFTFYF